MDTTTLIIVGALAALVLFLLVRRAMSRGEEETGAVPVTPAAPVPTANPVVMQEEGIDARTVALITAAAMAVAGAPIRVKRITFLNQNTVSAWAEVGRISIQTSHNVRRSL